MRASRMFMAGAVLCVGFGGVVLWPTSSPIAQAETGNYNIAGRKVRCDDVRIVIDHSLPSEGGALDDTLLLNPRMLNQQPETVRLFVFHHECGHTKIGDSELKADCWAVERGVRDGWLDKKGLTQVCDSFEGAPETSTHPSAARRCRHLDQCFSSAVAAHLRSKPPVTSVVASAPDRPPPQPSPRLAQGPTLAATGAVPSDAGRAPLAVTALRPRPCPPLPDSTDANGIAKLIERDAARQGGCR